MALDLPAGPASRERARPGRAPHQRHPRPTRPRAAPHRAWLLEIVGFWTPGYLARKLELLGRAGMERLILCIDAERACGERTELALPRGARAVFFRRRLDVDAVLAVIHADGDDPACPSGR